jgi:L-rhamnose mutarotase
VFIIRKGWLEMPEIPETTTERVCFLLHLKPDRVQDYLAAHEVVWPEMLDALREAGWHNYSLFIRSDDGLVVGYLETPDFAAAQQAMAATAVNEKWQAGMAEFFLPPAGAADGVHPDEAMRPLTEYFHLD